jgi:hypothetical protein
MMNELVRAEYEALRQEILATQRRDFQVLSVGAVAIPGANYLVHITGAEPLLLALPVLVIVTVLMHLANTHSIVRIARYISDRIEPLSPIEGWETWLRTTEKAEAGRRVIDNRRAERYMRAAVFLLFGAYFAGTTWFAGAYALGRAGFTGAIVVLVIYGVVAILLSAYVWRNLPLAPEGAVETRIKDNSDASAPPPPSMTPHDNS